MADSSDVEVALAQAALDVLYPNGATMPSRVGVPIRVYRGWPLAIPLEKDLSAGVSNISVFPLPESSRNTTRWSNAVWTVPGLVTMTIAISDLSASFQGNTGNDQVVGLIVDEQAFVYRCSDGDTPALVAATLAGGIQVERTCWLSGSTLTVPGARRLIGRVAVDCKTYSELARQEQGYRVSAWCPTPTLRDQICAAICSVFAATAFIDLSDGSTGRLRYRSTASIDSEQDSHQYRRDLLYDVEYGTLSYTGSPSMLFGDLVWAGGTTFV